MFRCMTILAAFAFAAPVTADDWPQWLGPNRSSVSSETGWAEQFPDRGPKELWRIPIGGGYAGPAVADGRVYVMDYRHKAGEVANNPGVRNELQGSERVLCLDAKTGKEVWKYEYDCPYRVSYPAGPRCTPTVSDGKVYALGAMGNLTCLDAAEGTELWSKDFVKDYKAPVPQWGFCGHPLVDGQTLYCMVGGEGSIVVAFNKDTGEERWTALSAPDAGYAPPVMIAVGGTKQLIAMHPASVNSLNPETGKPNWSVPLKPNYGMSIATPRLEGDLLFASGIGDEAICVRLGADPSQAKELWRGDRDTGVYCANSTPFIAEGFIYGCDGETGAFICCDLKTGERKWSTYEPTAGERTVYGTAFIVKNGDHFYLFNDSGHLIIAKLSPEGYEEVSRAKILEPTNDAFGRPVVWTHPAFAERCCFARNDKELVCVSLNETP